VDKAMAYLAVGVGSALGGMGRFWISSVIGQRYGDAFPWGTILVNVTGSLAIGVLAALAGTEDRSPTKLSPFAAQFFMAGVCGGYTTFSAFSLQTLKLIQAGCWPQAGANVALSVAACAVAVWIGYVLGQAFNR
jgi:CrcB protein